MVDYDESDLIAKMQQEVDLKKQYERIKIEEQKQICYVICQVGEFC